MSDFLLRVRLFSCEDLVVVCEVLFAGQLHLSIGLVAGAREGGMGSQRRGEREIERDRERYI